MSRSETVMQAINYIETHFSDRLDIGAVASSLCYSKYHLHRMFTEAAGISMHEYIVRRRLTEAARLIVFTRMPIADIALFAGYGSRQAFSDVFKAMYKCPPAEFRAQKHFYPLLLPYRLNPAEPYTVFKNPVPSFARPDDAASWMELVRMTIDGYPCFDAAAYKAAFYKSMEEHRALILKDNHIAAGGLIFNPCNNSIDFFAVHPQYRGLGTEQALFAGLQKELSGEISITTFRERDRADTGWRAALGRLGFCERELLIEFGYPTQRMVRLF